MTAAGHYTTYVDPGVTGGGNPQQIVKGAGNNLWFVEAQDPPYVARIVPRNGQITHLPLKPGWQSLGIAAGADGALWIGEHADNGHYDQIARVTTRGTISYYPIKGYRLNAYSLTTGSNGEIWFLAASNAVLSACEIATSGTISCRNESQISGSGLSTPFRQMALGADGAIWEPQTGPTQLNRIAPDGSLIAYPVPSTYAPESVVAGTSGKLWASNAAGGVEVLMP